MKTVADLLAGAGLLLITLGLFIPPDASAETADRTWVRLYNGTGNNSDTVEAVTTDSNANVLVTGSSFGSNTGFDLVTIKYSSTGVPNWTNRYNCPANSGDAGAAIAVDSVNDVIVAGYTTVGTNTHFLTIKYSSAGVPLWTNLFNDVTNGNARAIALAVDSANNVMVTGSSSGGDFATIRYSSNGIAVWTNFYNGPANGLDVPSAIAVDGNDHVIVTGRSVAGGIGSDYLTIKYTPQGSVVWTRRYDGPSNNTDEPSAIALDSKNGVIVTGRSVSNQYSFCTIKYSEAGTPLWTNYFRDPSGTTAFANAVAVDREDKVFVTGSWYAGSYQNCATVAYSSSGVPLWTNSFSSSADKTDIGRAVKVDHNGGVLVAVQSNNDIVTLKYSNLGRPLWTNIYNGPANGSDTPKAMALDREGDFIIAGQADAGTGGWDYVTIKFRSPPAIASVQLTNGLLQLAIRPPNRAVIHASSNLSTWAPIFTNSTSTNLLLYADPLTHQPARRFYRISRLP